jgi:membrane-bound metal-dependent hydrolase YbcI (DUF457 family)
MNVVVAVVLVAGVAVLARFMAGKRGFSHNQRIVLSAIAVGLVLWKLFSDENGFQPASLALVAVLVVVLASSLWYLRRQGKQ